MRKDATKAAEIKKGKSQQRSQKRRELPSQGRPNMDAPSIETANAERGSRIGTKEEEKANIERPTSDIEHRMRDKEGRRRIEDENDKEDEEEDRDERDKFRRRKGEEEEEEG
jgi:hypothetical protein